MLHSANQNYQIQTLRIDPKTDITDIFHRYSDQSWSMLLDSSNSQHKNARFDIMVAQPVAWITAKGHTCTICDIDQTRTIKSGDPITLLRELMQTTFDLAAPTNRSPSLPTLPFGCGAVGFFGYDLGRCFEELPHYSRESYETPDMAVGLYAWSLIKDNHTGTFYLCCLDGFDSPQAEQFEQNAQTKPTTTHNTFTLTSEWHANMDEAQYKQNLAKVHDYLRAGDCYQVNLAQRFQSDYSGTPWQAYTSLREANRAPFSAYINLPHSSVISISPERFLSVRSGQVETQPIKGTRPRSTDKKEDEQHIQALQSSVKDRAENLMIVDLLRNDLSKSCQDHSIQVPQLFAVESFAAVHHLVSTVTGKLTPKHDALSLLRGAFPGGSITGAPKIRAMEIIDELEPHKRNIYCGSIGYIDLNGDMDTSICIRTLLCENNTIYCWAGGGIVLDSVDKDEYQESFDKVSKILPVLAKLKG
ncbi:aminodeoxychorismate synthase component I [Aliiglaciecola litoralis]|uniref:aminodeoxychorismate synthase n=1 Tax=Aliiglaciecola litoralis TaxID=582857 RepID=A0ABP3WWV6_9ALTE